MAPEWLNAIEYGKADLMLGVSNGQAPGPFKSESVVYRTALKGD